MVLSGIPWLPYSTFLGPEILKGKGSSGWDPYKMVEVKHSGGGMC